MSEVGAVAGPRSWSFARYLLAVLLATVAAICLLAWARPSIFTSIVVVSGMGHRLQEAHPLSFYAVRVAPILEEQCAGCHGPRLQRARLRLDTLGDLKLGGKNGPVVIAGDPQSSELFRRLTLPGNDKRAMPAGSKPPLSEDEIRVIELWIASGASGETRVDSIAGAPPPPPPPIVVEALDAEAVAKARAPLRAQVQDLLLRYPGSIAYESRGSARLAVDVQRMGEEFDDADLAQFEPLAQAVARMDLSGTAITDAAAATLAVFEHVEALRLNDTEAGDAVLAVTTKMRNLNSLTLIDTRATAERIAERRRQGVRVYDSPL